ncbi:MAG: DEAD/DEAH box helicase [Verrucomicrobiales bacterium]
MSFEITERWLMDAGGWQAMKPARAAWQSGAVLTVEFDGTRLRGQVRAGARTLAAGLVIKSPTDVTNLCACPVSRNQGALCEHSLALGLAWVHRVADAAAPSKGKMNTGLSGRAAAGPTKTPSATGNQIASASQARQRESPHHTAGPTSPRTRGPLGVTLPPNFADGLRRNRLSVSLRPEKASTREESAADRAVHEWLSSHGMVSVPPQVALADPGHIETLFQALVGHPTVMVGTKKMQIAEGAMRLPLRSCHQRNNISQDSDHKSNINIQHLAIPSHGPRVPAPRASNDPGSVWLEIDPSTAESMRFWAGPTRGMILSNQGTQLHILTELTLLLPFFDNEGKPIPREMSLAWLARHGDELSEVFEVDESDPAWPSVRLVPGRPGFRLILDGSRRRLTARLWCEYPGLADFTIPNPAVHGESFPIPDGQNPGQFFERNLPAEEAAVARLERAGFEWQAVDNQFVLNSEQQVLTFFAGDWVALERVWTVVIEPRAQEAFRGLERLTPQFRPVASGQDWLAFDLSFVGSGGTRISAAEARRWLQSGGQRRLPGGKLAVLDPASIADLEEVLRDVNPRQEHGQFRIDRKQLGYLEASVATAGEAPTGAGHAFELESIEIPAEWRTILRPYQVWGAQWMMALAQRGCGGILADEMGLGKTVQTLAVISTLRRRAATAQQPCAPCLVVAPTSLLGNWREEAERFAPELVTLVVRSGERSADLARLGRADLVITSYALLVRDLDHHRAIVYQAAFLDEAGFIRNADTQSARAARRLETSARFALTGTPIENSIRDLWSIMEFVMPGYLGSRDDFRDRYEAVVAAGDTQAFHRLRRRMAPYWLRRLKQEVARDLPAKIEKIVRCELTPVQRDIYAALQREGVRKVEEARMARGPAQVRLSILTALLRLRQTCGDPRLLGDRFDSHSPAELSGKWSALLELLEEIRDGGHNVLIFSQFTSQLDLLEPALRESGLDFCRLDGSSRDREAQVHSFRHSPEKRAFLISLKAGGFGLNLTKADTVIHFDPWWNPAVEAQATDRAHRIGQDRPVTIYKFIATATVEEKILALQQKKRALMESALADDATPLMDDLDDHALHQLLGAS